MFSASPDLKSFILEFELLQAVELYFAKMKNRVKKYYAKWRPLMGDIIENFEAGLVNNYIMNS